MKFSNVMANAERAIYRAPALFAWADTIRFRTEVDNSIVRRRSVRFRTSQYRGSNPCHLIGTINRDSALRRRDLKGTPTCETQPLSFGMSEIVNLRLARKARRLAAKRSSMPPNNVLPTAHQKRERKQAAADRDPGPSTS